MAFLQEIELLVLVSLAFTRNAQCASVEVSTGPMPDATKLSNETLASSRRTGRSAKCDTHSQLARKLRAEKFWGHVTSELSKARQNGEEKQTQDASQIVFLSNKNDVHNVGTESNTESSKLLHRVRRWDDYNWEDGGEAYFVPGTAEETNSKFSKYALAWEKHSMKIIFVVSVSCMVFCCLLGLCKACIMTACKLWLGPLCLICTLCRGGGDPAYSTAKKYADDLGVKLDPDKFKKMKKSMKAKAKELK